MNPFTKLWSRVQNDPVFMRSVNGWATLFWILMVPISLALGWTESVAFVSALSLWALVSGHLSAWQASRVEVEQKKQADEERGKELKHDEELLEKIDEITPDK